MTAFHLTFRGRETWSATWEEEKVRVFVAGSDDAPYPVLLATLHDAYGVLYVVRARGTTCWCSSRTARAIEGRINALRR